MKISKDQEVQTQERKDFLKVQMKKLKKRILKVLVLNH
jgi:hypothetical protein